MRTRGTPYITDKVRSDVGGLPVYLEKVDAATFEKPAEDVLSERGYEVSLTEGTGPDGGRDADLRHDDETGVAALYYAQRLKAKAQRGRREDR